MGSTVVIIAEPDMLELAVEPGKKVSYAETIATVKE
jgi:hypothetical protein